MGIFKICKIDTIYLLDKNNPYNYTYLYIKSYILFPHIKNLNRYKWANDTIIINIVIKNIISYHFI